MRVLLITTALLAGCSDLKPSSETVADKPKFKVIATRPAGTEYPTEAKASFEFIPPTPDRGAMIFDHNSGCLAEVNIPKPTNMTGQIVEGKKLDAEQGRQWFGMIYFNQWTCPKSLNERAPEATK